MATFKVCDHDCTHWITDVEQLTEIESFPFIGRRVDHPDDPEITGKEVLTSLKDARKKRGEEASLPHSYTLASFEGQTSGVGKVVRIVVKNQDKPLIWIIPAHSGYLISDTGKTIDRL